MDVQIPEKLAFLYEPARYKVLYGGRGGAKSWNIARTLIIMGLQRKLRILCVREFQKSINDSVHKLLADQIANLGLQHIYEVQKASIVNRQNGTEFFFAGIRQNVGNVKSFEGVDVVWAEEANTVTKHSWDVLLPTIRKEGSEIWISFNPELDTDETYKRFVVDPPTGAKVVKVNYKDNPWFPSVLEQERLDLKEKDEDSYLNVWEGFCRQSLDGAIYAKEIRQATKEGRICRVLPLPGKPIETFWDLGKRDHTAIWFAQFNMGEYRIIDFYENRGEQIGHYLKVLQDKKYLYGQHWLPHDARQSRLSGDTIENIVNEAYPDKVKVLPSISVVTGIDAARRVFPNCYFDEEKCTDGLQHLRHYRFRIDASTGQPSKEPLHDLHSDCADAFRYLALSLDERDTAMTLPMLDIGGNWAWS